MKNRVGELEEANINVRKLTPKEEEKLIHLRVIDQYLNRAIDEHQKILNSHFDLKALYTKELEALSQMSLIRRFPLRTSLYDKILEQPDALERLEYFLRPLFYQEPEKSYNLNKTFQLQKPLRKAQEIENEERLDFDAEGWEQEQERLRRDKLKRYENSLVCLLKQVVQQGELSLKELSEQITDESMLLELIPDVEIFKEIMVELIRNREINIQALKKEQREYIQEQSQEFQLNVMLLNLVEEYPQFHDVAVIRTYRVEDGEVVTFPEVLDERGNRKTIRCSNVQIQVRKEEL